MMEQSKLSSDWNMGNPTSKRLTIRQSKVFEE